SFVHRIGGNHYFFVAMEEKNLASLRVSVQGQYREKNRGGAAGAQQHQKEFHKIRLSGKTPDRSDYNEGGKENRQPAQNTSPADLIPLNYYHGIPSFLPGGL